MFTGMKMMKLTAPLCLLLASIGAVSGLLLDRTTPPETGFLESFIPGDFTMGNRFCVSANDGSKKADDLRDEHSFYANTRNSCQRRTVFHFIAVTETEYVLQAVDINTQLADVANGWFLSVHDDRDSDNAGVNGDIRVILQPDYSTAATWEFTEVGGRGKMTVASNPGPAGEATIGKSLAVAEAPFRSGESFYLAVTGHHERALDVYPVAEALWR